MKFLTYDNPPFQDKHLDAIVILGTDPNMIDFSLRASLGYSYAKRNPNTTLVVSRNTWSDNTPLRSEADHMKCQLLAMGIEAERILCESESTNTRENVFLV